MTSMPTVAEPIADRLVATGSHVHRIRHSAVRRLFGVAGFDIADWPNGIANVHPTWNGSGK
jgi:hypothetical protein